MKILFFILFVSSVLFATDTNRNEAKKLFERSMKTLKPDEKILLRKQIIEISPESDYGYFSRGYIAEMEKDFENAETLYLKAIEINPKFGQAFANLGYLMMNLGKPYGYAMDYYQNAIQLEPNNSDFHSGLCYTYMKDPNPSNGIKYCNKAVELNSKNSLAYLSRASLRLTCHDPRGAIRDLNLAIKLKPDLSEAYQLRGLSQIVLGNKDSGCADLSKSGELGNTAVYENMKEFCQ
ncbi:tetratricopeptide repeat protein [Leptospira santarosai]|uniref:tetratricopeptide repeat protein n=1 Tax=Leptospira santarosai TaxID=28183 RepID=UPI0002BEE653|nr:tetratricopeptide repeat protein [Leptospira santarosai]EMO84364.1 tetratricopeptide repeat protein [Leptospira santarosai str. AIM]